MQNLPPTSLDEEHLRLLSIFHYVMGGLTALFSLFPIFHLVLGLVFIFAPPQASGHGAPPEFIGWVFVVFAVVFILFGLALATCKILAGRFLARRKHYTFCLIVAGVECLLMPFGTILGIFTIIVLQRPAVKARFAAAQPA